MKMFSKLYYNTWNIGFVERSIEDILLSDDTIIEVKWLKHNFKDRFFADPFIASIDNKTIKVLVEDYPFYDKKGMISLLTIDRTTFELQDRRVILKQPFHMSYPFIQRNEDGSIKWVAPEASKSGKLYRYSMDKYTNSLVEQKLLLDKPALDSTIIKYNNKYWLFCTMRGIDSNSKLYIYYSYLPEGPWIPHPQNPVVDNSSMSRPAGNFVNIDNNIFRVIQKCDLHYGEAINISKIDVLNELEFKETFIKELRAQNDQYSECFHTINSFDNICVVDALRTDFRPISRVWFEIRNLLHL